MITNEKRLLDLTVAEMRTLLEETSHKTNFSNPLGNQDSIPDIGGMDLAMEVTGLKRPTLYALVSNSRIPHMKRGKRLYFSRSELLSWIKDGKRKTVDELKKEAGNKSTRKK